MAAARTATDITRWCTFLSSNGAARRLFVTCKY